MSERMPLRDWRQVVADCAVTVGVYAVCAAGWVLARRRARIGETGQRPGPARIEQEGDADGDLHP